MKRTLASVQSVDALLVKLTVVTALSGHSGLSIEAGEFEHVQARAADNILG